MGKRLIKAFDIAKEEAGTQAQFRLSIRSGMSIVRAEKEPDNDHNLSKMKIALGAVLGKMVEI
jgi:hypothetical protein